MAAITEARSMIYEEEVAYKRPVSESTWNKIGASINFINLRQFDTKRFSINGAYGRSSGGYTGIDGLFIFPFDAEIFDVAIYNMVNGSSGTTEIDVKLATASGGSFSTIFSTTPKIASTAGDNAYVSVGGSGTGLTAPVLSGGTGLYNVSAGDAIRGDFVSRMLGAEDAGVIIYHRPR